MAFTLNDIDIQMTLTFEPALVEYKHVDLLWNLFNHELDAVTLVLKLDLNIIKMYGCTESDVPSFQRTDRHTDSTEIITYPHTWMVKIGIRLENLWHYFLPSRFCIMLLIDMVLIFQAYKKPKAFIATQGEHRFFTGFTDSTGILLWRCSILV